MLAKALWKLNAIELGPLRSLEEHAQWCALALTSLLRQLSQIYRKLWEEPQQQEWPPLEVEA